MPAGVTTDVLQLFAANLPLQHGVTLPHGSYAVPSSFVPTTESLIRDLAEKERQLCQNMLYSMLSRTANMGYGLMLPSTSEPRCHAIVGVNEQSLTPPSQGITPPDTPTSSCSADVDFDRTRPHLCTICGKRFRFKSNLFEHKSLHQESHNQFSCPFCTKTCRLKGNLKKHLQIHVNTADDLEKLWKERFSRSSGRPRKFPVTTSQ